MSESSSGSNTSSDRNVKLIAVPPSLCQTQKAGEASLINTWLITFMNPKATHPISEIPLHTKPSLHSCPIAFIIFPTIQTLWSAEDLFSCLCTIPRGQQLESYVHAHQ